MHIQYLFKIHICICIAKIFVITIYSYIHSENTIFKVKLYFYETFRFAVVTNGLKANLGTRGSADLKLNIRKKKETEYKSNWTEGSSSLFRYFLLNLFFLNNIPGLT
jgi:hypothetical protein